MKDSEGGTVDTKIVFQRATMQQAKLRMALDGPAGSGKTFTGLIAATALCNGGRIAVIDTEHGSASKYAKMFEFYSLQLTNFHPERYIDGIRAAEEAGYSVILIDSLSHAWEGEGGVLELHDQATAREPGKNSYTSWRLVTPIQRDLVEAILQSKCHIIATMRSKTEYMLVEENGKQKPQKVGMAPIQRQGMEYEFDVVADLDTDHKMIITKSRCFAIADAVVTKPTVAWFGAIKTWLGEGAPAVEKPVLATPITTTVAKPPENPTQLAPGNGKSRWSESGKVRAGFWAETGRRGLTNDQVHTVLGHEHLAQYPGSFDEALALIDSWINARTADAQVDALNVPAQRGIPF